MGKIRGLDGTVLSKEGEGAILVDQEHYLNLVARVQNLEACLICLAQLAQHSMSSVVADELDIVMEAWHRAQVQRGALHLEREPTEDDPSIFV